MMSNTCCGRVLDDYKQNVYFFKTAHGFLAWQMFCTCTFLSNMATFL